MLHRLSSPSRLTTSLALLLLTAGLIEVPAGAVAAAGHPYPHGFRHDPLAFADADSSVQAALVRSRLLDGATAQDRRLVNRRISVLLATQRHDGSFGQTDDETARRAVLLLDLGAEPDRVEMRRALDILSRQGQALSPVAVEALCRAGRSALPAVQAALRRLADRSPVEEMGTGSGTNCSTAPADGYAPVPVPISSTDGRPPVPVPISSTDGYAPVPVPISSTDGYAPVPVPISSTDGRSPVPVPISSHPRSPGEDSGRDFGTNRAATPAEESQAAEASAGSQASRLRALWAGRHAIDTRAAVAGGLQVIAMRLDGLGCLPDTEPWALVDMAGTIALPEAGRVLRRLVPLILRAQQPDGGWGEHSHAVLRALLLHRMLEPLRRSPPLPPAWRIGACIPAPTARAFSLAWDGRVLWTLDPDDNRAIALARETGAVQHIVRLPAPGAHAIAIWDGALAVVQRKPARVLQVDPTSGRVLRVLPLPADAQPIAVAQAQGRLYVADDRPLAGYVLDPDVPDQIRPLGHCLPGPSPVAFAPTGDAMWHLDSAAHAIILSDMAGNLLDWFERPPGAALRGLAWDGRRFWALDGAGHRICAIGRIGIDDADCVPCEGRYEVIRLPPTGP